MKIDSNLKPTGTGSVSGSRPRAAKADAPSSGTAAEVKLSAASAELSASSNSPVDSARIAEIKQAISEGRFKIDASAIADGLLSTARDLLQSQRKA